MTSTALHVLTCHKAESNCSSAKRDPVGHRQADRRSKLFLLFLFFFFICVFVVVGGGGGGGGGGGVNRTAT